MKEYFPKKENGEINLLFEKLAAIEHERWVDWQKYCIQKLNEFLEKDNGKLDIILDGWQYQISTPYEKLCEKDKDSDREQVMRYWHLINS